VNAMTANSTRGWVEFAMTYDNHKSEHEPCIFIIYSLWVRPPLNVTVPLILAEQKNINFHASNMGLEAIDTV
jgi:hypothetical protein